MNRRELEDLWREYLIAKEQAYRAAGARYAQLLNATPEEHSLESSGSAVAEAELAVAQAVEDYARVLRIFTELTLNGKLPKETMAREAVGA